MVKSNAALAASLATLCAFTACSDLGESGPRPLATEPDYIGEYSLNQDRVVMTTIGDTQSYCDGPERRVLARPTETDNLEFHIVRDRLSVLNAPEVDGAAAEAAPVPQSAQAVHPAPVVRISWEASRVGSGANHDAAKGLEGRWRIVKFDYHLISGILTDSLVSEWDSRLRAWRKGNELGISEIEFKEGRAYARSDIRWADLFVADWNGELQPEAREAGGSLHDIEVKALDRFTVEMKGHGTGETVLLTFSKKGDRTFSSDRGEHQAYQVTREPVACPEDPGKTWFESFKAANLRSAAAP